MLLGHAGDSRGWNAAVAALLLMLTGCGGTPVHGDLRPRPAPSAATAAASAPAASTTVEATVITRPVGRTVYHIIRVKIPEGVSSLSITLPEDTMPEVAPPPALPVPAQGGEQDCSQGFFSCSKLISESISAAVAAILALLGLYGVLRRKRGKHGRRR